MNGSSKQFTFDSPPERLDKYLVSRLPDLSRSRLQSLIKEGQVKVNGSRGHESRLHAWGRGPG